MIGITPGFENLALMLCQSLAESGPQLVDEFDDAWTPGGENYRDELVSGGLVTVAKRDEDGPLMVTLTGAGVALASSQPPLASEPAPQA